MSNTWKIWSPVFTVPGRIFNYLLLSAAATMCRFTWGWKATQAEACCATPSPALSPAFAWRPIPRARLGHEMNQAGLFAHLGRLTGIPMLKSSRRARPEQRRRAKGTNRPDRHGRPPVRATNRTAAAGVIRPKLGLPGSRRAYAEMEIRQRLNQTLQEIGQAASQMKWQMQRVQQTMRTCRPTSNKAKPSPFPAKSWTACRNTAWNCWRQEMARLAARAGAGYVVGRRPLFRQRSGHPGPRPRCCGPSLPAMIPRRSRCGHCAAAPANGRPPSSPPASIPAELADPDPAAAPGVPRLRRHRLRPL
jgi:hypothetical protein